MRRVIAATILGLALVFGTVTVVHADNCTGPRDTQRCSAAINATAWGAAVVAAIGAAAGGAVLNKLPTQKLEGFGATPAEAEAELKDEREKNCRQGIQQLDELANEIERQIVFGKIRERGLINHRALCEKEAQIVRWNGWVYWLTDKAWTVADTAGWIVGMMLAWEAVAAASVAGGAGAAGAAGAASMAEGAGILARMGAQVTRFKVWLTTSKAAVPAIGAIGSPSTSSGWVGWAAGHEVGPTSYDKRKALDDFQKMQIEHRNWIRSESKALDTEWEHIKQLVQSYKDLVERWYAECNEFDGRRPTSANYFEEKLPKLELESMPGIFGGPVVRRYMIDGVRYGTDAERYEYIYARD
jgi:hypothetical protein